MRHSIAFAFRRFRTPEVESLLLDLHASERDWFVQHALRISLADFFSDRSWEILHEAAQEDADFGMIEAKDLRESLLAQAAIRGREFPEAKAWRADWEAAQRRFREYLREEQLPGRDFTEPTPAPAAGLADYLPGPVPSRTSSPGPSVGRNDPCPCGSGRKFKKCCGAPNMKS